MKNKVKDEMQADYDLRGKKGVRGKYAEAIKNGYTTIIHQSDGSTVVKETRPVYLDEDVREFFPDTQSVNKALRGLIALVPEKR